jgi:tryptophan 2,3-dioxygenase
MSITYTNYLKVDELLELQKLKSDPPEHDETLFIIIHQTYELWFKQIIHEFGKFNRELAAGNTWTSIKTMRRILTIMKTLVSQVDILETMTPLEFNSFRKFLGQSSGFQSLQFREIEILCGIRLPLMKEAHKDSPKHLEKLEKRMQELTIWESFGKYLAHKGFSISTERVNEKGLLYNSSNENQTELIKMMSNDPEAALVSELLVDFDEGLQEWRYRHVKMVQRTIGAKMGTGGSEGVSYLQKTLNQCIFPDLWEIRSEF